MKDVIFDTIVDNLKILPFLFVAFLLLEYLEHKVSNKSKEKIKKAGFLGPIIGSILGAIPQCGFGVAATNLYAARVISIGTLIAVYLSTSDEMLPIMLSSHAPLKTILSIILLKILIGIIWGFIIDFILRNKGKKEATHICEEEHCHCEESILLSSMKHTLNIIIYIFIFTFLINIGIYYLGEDNLGKLFLKNSLLGPFLSSLIGLIPNCASSVVITELYLNNAISFGSVMAGLLTGSGVSLLMLFKVNKDIKENINIISILYLIGALSGFVIEIVNLL